MYRLNVLLVILTINFSGSLQVLPPESNNINNNNKTVDDLMNYLKDINQVKSDIIESVNIQQKGIETLDKLLDGPGKDFENVVDIKEDASNVLKSSTKLGKTVTSIIDSINPYMNETIEKIIKCKDEIKSVDDEKICKNYIYDAHTTLLNNLKFVNSRLKTIQKNGNYIQNLLNELTLKLQNNKADPHSREEIIAAHLNDFNTAIDNIKMYRKLSEEKKNYITLESEKISDLRNTTMRSLKAIKRFNKVGSESLQTQITHEYMFMKHTEGDLYKYIDDVLVVLVDADNTVNFMFEKFKGNDKITVDDIVKALDYINEIIDNVIFTFSEEGNIYRAIGVFKVSIEKSRRLFDKANNFVDELLLTRNTDVYKPFKKPFKHLTVKNVYDSIKLLEYNRMDLQNKVNNVKNIVEYEELMFKNLNVITKAEYKSTRFHEKLLEIGGIIIDESIDLLDEINNLLILHKYDQTLFYMSNCLNKHTRNGVITVDNILINEKLRPDIDCREGFKLLWNINDRNAKNKINKALSKVEEKLYTIKLMVIMSAVSRDYESLGKSMEEVLNEIVVNNPEIGNFLTTITENELQKYLTDKL